MANSEARKRRFEQNSAEVKQFADKHNLNIRELNHGYQLRIGGVIDIYPTNKRWHYLVTGERGGYTSITDIDLQIFRSDLRNELLHMPDTLHPRLPWYKRLWNKISHQDKPSGSKWDY